MSSRQEEKQQRRAAREAAEAEQAQAQQRKRIALIAGGAVALITALVIIVVVVAGSGGGDDGQSKANDDVDGAAVPARKIEDLAEAVKAAKCTFREFPSEGQTHSEKVFKDYKTNPPTSGTHNPVWAEDGIYDPGSAPPVNKWVHALEHGRIVTQYKPGTPEKRVAQLRTLVSEELRGESGFKQLLLENNTKMPYAVAAVSWTRYVGCKEFTDKSFDAIRAFRDEYVEKAPEFVP